MRRLKTWALKRLGLGLGLGLGSGLGLETQDFGLEALERNVGYALRRIGAMSAYECIRCMCIKCVCAFAGRMCVGVCGGEA